MERKFLLITLLFACTGLLAQTTIHVKGVVTDAKDGGTLVGVNVMVSGTQSGATTDINGAYALDVAPDATLEFLYIGYKTKEIKVDGKNVINVKLEQNSELLDESVVVGYSVMKKRDVLGAVSKVSGDELTKVPVSSVQQSLQGRVAGVEVANQTGAPGSNISVRIRGTSSISSGNDPLYIVDGIPVEGALNNISPNDIANISVLKDASSAAIYGSRASNGVVLITTKTGRKGASRITYNMQTGFQVHGHLTPMANTAQYIELYNEAAATDNASSVVQRALIQGDYLKDFPDVNHLKEIFHVAPINSHELSISGGNDKTQYLLSGSYYDQDGIIKHTDYNRVSFRSNIMTQAKSWLKVGINATGAFSKNRYISSSGDGYVSEGGSVVRYALFRNPAIPVKNDAGNYVDLPSEYYGNSVYNSFFGDGYSPEGLAANTDMTKNLKTLLVTGNAIVNFTKDIFWKTTAGIDYKYSTLRVYNKTWGTQNRINSTNSLNLTQTEESNWTFNSTFNHSFSLGDNNVNYLIGTEAVHNHTDALAASDSDFPSTDSDLLYIGKGEGVTYSSQSESASSLLSFFANVNYNYKDKYYLSGIVRRDGSSRFSSGNRWGTFYSVSGGWNMEQEPFLANNPVISKLKLRVGYGSIGNQNIGLYAYSDRYSQGYYYAFGGKSYNGYAQTTLGNKNLKWETSNQLNAGVDLELYKGMLGASIDYYYKVTDNMLVQEALPLSVGDASTPWVNNGSVLNTGVDIELYYRKAFKDGGFDITLNGGYLYNEVLSLKSPILGGRVDSGIYATKTAVGHPIGSFYVYKMDGIFQNTTEILTSAYQGGDIEPGDIKYANKNGDSKIDANDRYYMGSAIPKFTTGLNLSGNYKGFDASMFFQGAFGQKIFSQVNYDIEGFYRGFNVTERYYKNHWTGEGSTNSYPRASWGAKSNNVKVSSRFLEDGSYLRLKNVQLGYTFNLPEKWKIQNLRLYLAATNLLTITGYSGLDPEMTVSTNSSSEGDRANGIDWGTYPVSKSYTFGVNLTF
ncbi:MAG: TonB-dependent receptor [Bacteroidales bacterium]|jgi:TonB-linked SusC/RagA family outer membrane protein|nr:TonB-dependent receptor [Bacteroidales bacterium]MCI1784752.1 TonB-dependent receptor [Bacteroidales bacterium]